jgi:hypothetical protein
MFWQEYVFLILPKKKVKVLEEKAHEATKNLFDPFKYSNGHGGVCRSDDGNGADFLPAKSSAWQVRTNDPCQKQSM